MSAWIVPARSVIDGLSRGGAGRHVTDGAMEFDVTWLVTDRTIRVGEEGH